MTTRFKVWIELETDHNDGERYEPDPMPECVGTFDTESEATELRRCLMDVADHWDGEAPNWLARDVEPLEALSGLVEWEKYMGGFEAKAWTKARTVIADAKAVEFAKTSEADTVTRECPRCGSTRPHTIPLGDPKVYVCAECQYIFENHRQVKP